MQDGMFKKLEQETCLSDPFVSGHMPVSKVFFGNH